METSRVMWDSRTEVMRRMNLNRLIVFHAVARTGSFTRASEELFLTQPGVSKHVKALEEHYGVKLFDRFGKRVVLTQAGVILYEATREMLSLLEQARLRIDDLQGINAGTLTIGASVTIGIYIVPEIVKTFSEQYPNVEVALDIAMSRQVVDRVLDNKVDVGLVGHKTNDERVQCGEFMTDEFVLVLPADHPWRDRESIPLDELTREPFLISRRGSGTQTVMEERLRQEGLVLRNAMEFGNTEAVKKGVLAGLGISILSRHTISTELEAGLIQSVPLEGVRLDRRLYFIHRKEKYLTKAVEAFLNLLTMTQHGDDSAIAPG